VEAFWWKQAFEGVAAGGSFGFFDLISLIGSL
jgi:hypothetical protein